jgi:hypothetical protein
VDCACRTSDRTTGDARAPLINLRGTDRKTFSQNGEDGILEKILETIGTTNKYFVEIGAGNGQECNTRLLLDKGWHGAMMDRNGVTNVQMEHVTAENVNDIFAKYHVPQEFDVLSIDIDGNDYWVWKAITYTARVVVIEWNCSISPFKALAIPYSPNFAWDSTCYYGASILALTRLGERKGMILVAADKRATNLFFVRAQYAHLFEGAGYIEAIYPDWHWSHAEDHQKRKYVEV